MRRILIALALVAGIALAACGSNNHGGLVPCGSAPAGAPCPPPQ